MSEKKGEEDGQLLAMGRDLGAPLARKDRVVDLGRQIFRELPGQAFELAVGLGELVLDRLAMLDRRLVEKLEVRQLLLQGLELGLGGDEGGRFARGSGAGLLLSRVIHGWVILFRRSKA